MLLNVVVAELALTVPGCVGAGNLKSGQNLCPLSKGMHFNIPPMT